MNVVTISYIVTFTLLEYMTLSSAECNANIFYDYVYCVSPTSQCAQCIPCYNGELYIPNGQEHGAQCDSELCLQCTTNCKDTFNHNSFNQQIQNTDTSCPTLSDFISEMHSDILFTNISSSYHHSCPRNDTLLVQYAIISPLPYAIECTKDFSHRLSEECNEHNDCTFNLSDLDTCANTTNFKAEIGTFCIQTQHAPYKSIAPDNDTNKDTLTTMDIIYLSVISGLGLCLLIAIAIIICQRKGRNKHTTDAQQSLQPKRSERAQSDTIEEKDIITEGGPKTHESNNSSQQMSYIRPSNNAQTPQRNTNKTRFSQNYETYNDNVMRIRPPNNGTYTQYNQYNMYNDTSEQDTAVINFQKLGQSVTNFNRHSLSQSQVPQSGYVITTSDAIHNRNTSEIVHGTGTLMTQTQCSPYGSFSNAHTSTLGGNGFNFVSQNDSYNATHPHRLLNQSDVVYPGFNGQGTDELQSALVHTHTNMNGEEQKQMPQSSNNDYDYAKYWNQYYGISSTPKANINLKQSSGFDFANPNGDMDYFDNANAESVSIIQHCDIQLEAEIGTGTNSKVFKARWMNKIVAAKRFTNLDVSHDKAREYISKYASKVGENENVIQVMAVMLKPFTLLTEFMNKKSVKNYVRRSRPGSTSISILDRIEIAFQAAKGLGHLHSLGIVHSEVTCRNLLMELKYNSRYGYQQRNNSYNIADIRVVITDYAIQHMLTSDELEHYRSSLGPLKWMAPELIDSSNTKTTKESDIYAFGITMWEIITGGEPYPDVDPVDTAIHVLVKERRPQSYAFIPEQIQDLMKMCWHKNSKQRPSAAEVGKGLEEFILAEKKRVNDQYNEDV